MIGSRLALARSATADGPTIARPSTTAIRSCTKTASGCSSSAGSSVTSSPRRAAPRRSPRAGRPARSRSTRGAAIRRVSACG